MYFLFSMFLFLSTSKAFADIEGISEALNQIQKKNISAVNSHESEITALNSQILSLQNQLRAAQLKLMNLNQTEGPEQVPLIIKVTSEQIHKLLVNSNFGYCKISQGKLKNEYIITENKTKIKIRFFFNFENPELATTAELKLTGLNNDESVIEIEQKMFKPNYIEPQSGMQALIRYSTNSLKLTHATFRGQKIYRYPFGVRIVYTPEQVSCLL